MRLIEIAYRLKSEEAKCYILKNFKNLDYQIQIDCLDDAIGELEEFKEELREKHKKEFYLKRENNNNV